MIPVNQAMPMPAPAQAQPQQQGQQQAQQPQLGPDKWAQDGFQNLRSHANADDRKMLEENQDQLMLDPKAKNLLMTAQSFKPGSKPLDDIMKHLKKRMGALK
jgi:hypothetical protein